MELDSSKWELAVGEWINRVNAEADAAFRRICLDLFARIVQKTPVDTGMLRGNWHISLNATEPRRLPPQKYPSIVIAAGGAQLAKATIRETVIMQNNMPYARRIEYGWSKQAPNGMVRQSVGEVRANLPRVA